MWGTDSIWFGTPQDQIQAMRTFQISEALQEAHGYPKLTPEIKAGIFGLNAAALYDIEPITGQCDAEPGRDREDPRDAADRRRRTDRETVAEAARMIAGAPGRLPRVARARLRAAISIR